jgi:hypothetical protein
MRSMMASRCRAALVLNLILVAGSAPALAQDNPVAADSLRAHLNVLGADSLAGRGAGSEAYLDAAEYARGVFSRAGTQAIVTTDGRVGFFQEFTIPDWDGATTVNVVAFVPGSDPELRDQFVTAGAHLDGLGRWKGQIHNGANDNATGSAVVLELARYFGQHPPRRSVIFGLWGAEEVGIHGSRYFVANAPVPMEQVVAHVNFDGVGRYDRSPGAQVKIYALGGANICQPLEDELLAANATSGALEFDMDDKEGWFPYSDHFNFHEAGVPSVFLTDLGSDDYHKPTDDIEFIDFDKLALTAWTGLVLVENLANRDERICP